MFYILVYMEQNKQILNSDTLIKLKYCFMYVKANVKSVITSYAYNMQTVEIFPLNKKLISQIIKKKFFN